MSKGLGGVVNQAHLIHDQSAGRSSTRLHAPPGGRSAMGSSFAWGPEESAPLRFGRGSTPQSLRHLAGSGVFSVGDHAEPPATAVTSPLSAVAGVDVPRAPEVYQLPEAEATDSLAGHQEPPCPPPISVRRLQSGTAVTAVRATGVLMMFVAAGHPAARLW